MQIWRHGANRYDNIKLRKSDIGIAISDNIGLVKYDNMEIVKNDNISLAKYDNMDSAKSDNTKSIDIMIQSQQNAII